jgi:adenine-specific DNA-methyltransferase
MYTEKIHHDTFTKILEPVKPLTWEEAFPAVIKQGGFDAIIGNPPYVKEYTNREAFENVKWTSLGRYYQGKMDLCYFFICRGIDLLKENGFLGFIIPNNWTTNSGASILRNKIVTDSTIRCLYDFGNYNVFDSSSIQTMILLLKKNKQEQYTFDYRRIAHKTPNIETALSLLAGEEAEKLVYLNPTLNVEERKETLLVFEESDVEKVLKKIQEKRNFTLDANTEIAQGIVPNPDVVNAKNITKIPRKIRQQENIEIGDGVFVIENHFFKRLTKAEKKYIKPLFEPCQVRRYSIGENRKQIIYITKQNYNDDCPRIIKHLSKFKGIMAERRENKAKKLQFYHLHWGRAEEIFSQGAKILSVRKCAKPTFVYTEQEAFVMMAFNVIRSDRIDLKYLTALLNSRLVAFWLRHRGKMQGLQYQVDKEPLLSIPLVDTDNESVKRNIIEFVDELLRLYPTQDAALLAKRTHIDNHILYIEREINKLVYHLYDLTSDEIAIVEGNA